MSGTIDKSTPQGESDPEFDAMVEEARERLRSGEPVDFEAIAGGDPDRAERLRGLAPMMALMADLGRSAAGEAADGGGLEVGILGGYRLVRLVGRGGMGVVYEARNLALNRRVALKILPMAATVDPKRVSRFQLEARAAAYLSHRNIVQVFDVGCEGSLNYYAMEFISGSSLAEVIAVLRRRVGGAEAPAGEETDALSIIADLLTAEAGPPASVGGIPGTPPARNHTGKGPGGVIPDLGVGGSPGPSRSRLGHAYARAAARLGVQAAEALGHAHALGIVHRDVKPANLMVGADGHLWVTDFGLALVRDFGDLSLTRDGDRPGTLRYMSPEQASADGPAIDHRADIYALGATLYELLTLRPAVVGSNRNAIVRQIAEDDPTPPRRLNPAIPRDLETIILKAMAKQPGRRYASAAELALDLTYFLEHRPIGARRPSLPDRLSKWGRRHRVPIVATAATAAVALVVGLAVVGSAYESERDQRTRAEANAQLALATLGDVAGRIAGDDRLTLRGMGSLQIELLEVVLPQLEAYLLLEGGPRRT